MRPSRRRGSFAGAPLPAATLLLGLVAPAPGCGQAVTQRTRAAWGQATRTTRPEGGRSGGGGDTRDRGSGWPAMAQLVRRAATEVGTGDAARLTSLAQRWCQGEPTPRRTTQATVLVCFPAPPLQAGGQSFTLEFEIGDTPLVGFVSRNLSEVASRALLDEATRMAAAWCREPWQSPGTSTHGELRTCAVDGGAILSVGRWPRDLEADLWQVSLTLLGVT